MSHPGEASNELAPAAVECTPQLLDLLHSDSPETQEATLEKIAALTCDTPHECMELVRCEGGAHLEAIIELTKDNRPRIRLAAISVIVNLCETKTLPSRHSSLDKSLISMIISLFSEDPMNVDAPLLLVQLIADDIELQRIATEAEAVTKLGNLLQSTTNERLIENILHSLSIIVLSLHEEFRNQVADKKLLGSIVSSLSSMNPAIQAKACRCCRFLSRSKHLRTSLVDAGAAIPLFNLLDGPSLDVQIAASATLCNMMLDSSPMKKIVMDGGGIAKLVSLLKSTDQSGLKLNALWGLKNLAYEADLPIKEAILKELTLENIYELMCSADPAIQEQTLFFVRNFLFQHVEDIWPTEAQVNVLISSLEKLFVQERSNEHLEVTKQAIYVVSNLAAGVDNIHKNAVISSAIPSHLLHYLGHESGSVRVAAVWCIMNLSWAEGANRASAGARVSKLREMGFDKKLQNMVEDPDLDVRDRVKNVLEIWERLDDL